MMHSVLLIGQSNMAGRGYPDEVAPIRNNHLYVLRNGCWRPMYVPVNPDRETAGTNLAESFADLYAKEHHTDIGLIPCADGGSSLDQWQVGGRLFDHACYMAELASRTSTIVAVLWHQGESDASAERAPLYEEKFSAILAGFRERLGADIPFLIGGLGDYLIQNPDPVRRQKFLCYDTVNASLRQIADNDAAVGFVSAEGLLPNPDLLHICASSLREFGERYYRVFCELENKDLLRNDKIEDDPVSNGEFDNL